jgi:hypothetical protein
MNPRIKSAPNWRKRITLLLFSVVLVYAVWNARNLILGPQIEIFEPENGITVSSKTIQIKGVAINSSFLSLNGRQIFTDESGIFSEEILPEVGYNTIEIRAEDRFGKKINRIIKFYHDN